ncbi:hypothetical protein [Marinomonas algicola]|jgi:predicted small secreted protein|uniref:hypothetical protein n=1 Tax=Marinomonas algicola TaxID=2773454 RepID=UPI001748E2DE|nr:hypothetical protein [Marinomonas algicola]
MNINTKQFATFFTAAILSVSLTACGSNSAENAGEKVDEVITDTGNAIEDTCEAAKEKAGASDTDC